MLESERVPATMLSMSLWPEGHMALSILLICFEIYKVYEIKIVKTENTARLLWRNI